MTIRFCDEIAEELVDYADGELSGPESAAVAAHLAACERCRATLAALERSLVLARAIWEDGAANLAIVGLPVNARESAPPLRRVAGLWPPRLRRWHAAAIAAGLLLLVVIGWHWQQRREPPPVAVANTTAPVVAGAPSAAVAPSAADLERELARIGLSAELLGAADYLAEQPGGEEIACERYRYIVAAYSETAAAAESESRLQSRCDQRSTP